MLPIPYKSSKISRFFFQLRFARNNTALLIDQKLLRRDEMWVTERNEHGESSLFSFSEYKDVRYDKDIRSSYLDGRLGGVPRLLFSDCLRETSEP